VAVFGDALYVACVARPGEAVAAGEPQAQGRKAVAQGAGDGEDALVDAVVQEVFLGV